MIAEPVMSATRLSTVHPTFHISARNLLHYLALRRRDLRPLQLRLAEMGLSSLGRAESHVLATIDAVLEILHRLLQRSWQPSSISAALDFASGQRLLAEHTEALLGPGTSHRGVRIMVTMPSDAADDYMLVHNLLEQGAVRLLDDILQRMQVHQAKRQGLLRELRLAHTLPGEIKHGTRT